MAKVGRPSKFDPVLCEQATKLCLLGATDVQLSDFFGISVATLNTWKKEHPEFLDALKLGKELADAKVASSLYQRAIGYEHDDVHISMHQGVITQTPIRKYYAPDPTSGIFWLKNRQRDKWRDKQDHEHTGKDGGPIQTEEMSDLEAARRIAFLLKKAADEESVH